MRRFQYDQPRGPTLHELSDLGPELIPLGEFWIAYCAAKELGEQQTAEELRAYIIKRAKELAVKAKGYSHD